MERFRKILTVLAALAVTSAAICAETAERIYISTDKDVYIAGERIWCSVFNIDGASSGRLSGLSATAYIELQSADGTVKTAKAALTGGRGAAVINIPAELATGNYRLIGYTALNKQEKGYDYHANAKIISVFNALSSDRVEGGVEVVEEGAYAKTDVASSSSIRMEDGEIVYKYNGGEEASVSISVCIEDGIASPSAFNIAGFASRNANASASYADAWIPEYEGEIIHCNVIGQNDGKAAFIAAPAELPNLCAATIRNGKADFFTQNIYGDTDLVCQIENGAEGGRMELVSPFVEAKGGTIPALKICKTLAPAIIARSSVLKEDPKAGVDTLLDRMPDTANYLMGDKPVQYELDNYTRFPVMGEVITEFVSELRARKDENGMQDIQVKLADKYGRFYFSTGASLMMIDGVPILSHQNVYDYDPLLVKTINIYPYSFFVGDRGFTGAANFVTYRKSLQNVKFDDDVRIVPFTGTSYPCSYSGSANTLYWHPLVDIAAGSGIRCSIPAGSGAVRIKVEGLTKSGKAIFETAVIRK